MSQNAAADTVAMTRRVTWIGIVLNLALAAAKFVLGILGASQALVADAVHSLSDLGTDAMVIVGVHYWARPPDANHPYGHRRIETLITAAIGLALGLIAIVLAYRALIGLHSGEAVPPKIVALAGAGLSILLKEALFRWTVAAGQRIKSSSLIANAWHHRTDALSSVPVFITIAVAAYEPRWAFIDHLGAFVVSLFIVHAAWRIVAPAFAELIDSGASQEVQDRIMRIALAVDGVRSVHAVRTRRMGSMLYIDLHVMVDAQMTVEAGHEISHVVKQELLDKGPDVGDVIVHLEPFPVEK